MAIPKTTLNKVLPTPKTEKTPYIYPDIYLCHCCGKKWFEPEKFYKVTGNEPFLAEGNHGYVHVCKDCVNKYFEELKKTYSSESFACAILCSKFNWYWSEKLYLDIKAEKFDNFVFGDYLRKICAAAYRNLSFKDTLVEIIRQEKALIATSDNREEIEQQIFNDEEFEARQAVVEIVGYDPFEEHSAMDRKYLFKELIKYFDDDIQDDPYKLSMIIQLVINNNQIRRLDNQIALLSPLQNADEISKLNTIKKDLVLSNDKIAKENEISVKNRSNKEVGKNTLTFLMKKLRNLDFDKAETDFYDQLKSKGTQWAIDMSYKALSENAYFDENDWRDIGNTRIELVQKLQAENDDLKEEKRQLHAEIQNLKEQLESEEDAE